LDREIEQESALVLARKKWSSIKGSDRERKQKLMAMLMRRGFPSAVVKAAIHQVATESEDQESDSDFNDGDPYDSEYPVD
jgi:regulatory protein